MQKYVDRSQQSSDKIFDSRTLQNDFKTIVPIIKPGLKVLDVGCGTGAISKDIAKLVGNEGIAE
jgi:ubiquinone/menaquinone biosynthesis C-methylase UbiE